MNVSQLVKQAKKGNKEVLLQLIMADQDAYYRLAYAYMGNEHDAVEDMIVTLYEQTHQFQSIELVFENSEGYHKINEPISLASPSDPYLHIRTPASLSR